jgi:hypothetical protein
VEVSELRRILSDPGECRERSAEVMRCLELLPASSSEDVVREMTIRAFERIDELVAFAPLLSDLARLVGLYPYVERAGLPTSDLIAIEVNRASLPDGDYVMHREQARLLRKLVRRENLILSAPTSFGKSLLVDAAIAALEPANVLIVVPTIALIDETRRRLTARFRQRYKIITHPSQARGERNLFVLTQERIVGNEIQIDAEFLVLDEFYKLSPDQGDVRFALLNQVFYYYAKRGCHFYLLGPNIAALPESLPSQVSLAFERTTFQTVVTEVHRVEPGENPMATLVNLVDTLQGPTVIYSKSPASALLIAEAFAAAHSPPNDSSSFLGKAYEWVASHFDPSWTFAKGLQLGLGLHHGRIPRALAQFVVRRFNERALPLLVCTSTLIEGVNTAARNVVVFDNRIGLRQLDFFTYANIKGRSGRMFQHFVGHVYTFSDPPVNDLPSVDIPAFTQSDDAPTDLLVQLDYEDLSENSRRRIDEALDVDLLPREVARALPGFPVEQLVKLAQSIAARPEFYSQTFLWQFLPTFDQLNEVSYLLWQHFDRPRGGAVNSPRQLAFKLGRMPDFKGIAWLASFDINNPDPRYRLDPDTAVQNALDFTSRWCQHWVPRGLKAIQEIHVHVLGGMGLSTGNLMPYANSLEALFLPKSMMAIDEYGLPFQISMKLLSVIDFEQELDIVLDALRELRLPEYLLSSFEAEWFKEFQQAL